MLPRYSFCVYSKIYKDSILFLIFVWNYSISFSIKQRNPSVLCFRLSYQSQFINLFHVNLLNSYCESCTAFFKDGYEGKAKEQMQFMPSRVHSTTEGCTYSMCNNWNVYHTKVDQILYDLLTCSWRWQRFYKFLKGSIFTWQTEMNRISELLIDVEKYRCA